VKKFPEILLARLTQNFEATRQEGEVGREYRVCELCGCASLVSQHMQGAEPEHVGLKAAWGPPQKCPTCSSMHYKYPEVTAWVTRVLGFYADKTSGFCDPEQEEQEAPAPAPTLALVPPPKEN